MRPACSASMVPIRPMRAGVTCRCRSTSRVDSTSDPAFMNALLRCALSFLVGAGVVLGTRASHADAGAPSQRDPRPRTCCALAVDLPLHLGSAHVPVVLGSVV